LKFDDHFVIGKKRLKTIECLSINLSKPTQDFSSQFERNLERNKIYAPTAEGYFGTKLCLSGKITVLPGSLH